MNINTLKKQTFKKSMPIGTHEVTFDHIDYRTDKAGDIIGIFIHIDEFKPAYLNFFEDGNNFELDNFIEQVGADSYDPDIINTCKGTKITVTAYQNEQYTNVSFRAAFDTVEAFA